MNDAISTLMKQGTIGGIFLAVLLISLVYFAGFTRKMISEQLSIKDKRIEALEADVKELQQFNQKELLEIITDTQRMMQRAMDTMDRMENLLKRHNVQI